MNNWEETCGNAYRAAHKREHYEAINIMFRRDGADGLTKGRVQQAAADRGMSVTEYVKSLIVQDINKTEERH